MTNRQRSSRGRAEPSRVGKSFPWGVTVGGGLLAVGLFAVLAYAVTNAGSAAPSPLRKADQSIAGVVVAQATLSRDHKEGLLSYDRTPSWGGNHNPVWQTCTGTVYTQEIPQENATHSLEHGAVWVTYRPDLAPAQVQALAKLVNGQPYRLLSPYPGLRAPVSVQAWGRQLTLPSADDPRLATFLDTYTKGPQTPEPGATCSGGTAATGSTPSPGASS